MRVAERLTWFMSGVIALAVVAPVAIAKWVGIVLCVMADLTLKFLRLSRNNSRRLSPRNTPRRTLGDLVPFLDWDKPVYIRRSIPSRVKQAVWARDKGRCVLCGSRYNLHFDHDIPVSKGGSNTAENIRLLCQTCNLRKGAKIE